MCAATAISAMFLALSLGFSLVSYSSARTAKPASAKAVRLAAIISVALAAFAWWGPFYE